MADERTFPDVEFIETDTTTIVEELIEKYETEFGRTLATSDPIRQLILWFASVLSQERSYINIAAKRNLPRYAEGEYLDSLMEIFYDITRGEATPARTTLRFSLEEAVEEDVLIPEGTEVTTDGTIVFSTLEDATIQAGSLYTDVTAECEDDGTEGNGIEAGKLVEMLDSIAYVETVENTTVTAGGEDEEDDASFYARMRESYEAYSTAGTIGAYRYHAMAHNPSVSDVVVETPSAGCVDVTIMMSSGAPSESDLEDMQDYLRSDEIRPLTDYVEVKAPTEVPFAVNMTYYVDANSTESAETIGAAVRTATNKYIQWQTEKLGRKLNPSKLTSMAIAAGAAAVSISSPAATSIGKTAVGKCTGITITYGGVEE